MDRYRVQKDTLGKSNGKDDDENNDSNRKGIVFVVGASSGFGRNIASMAARKLKEKELHFVLVGRDVKEMKETATCIKKEKRNATFDIFELDLNQAINEIFDESALRIFEKTNMYTFDNVYLVHNSGVIRPTKYIHNQKSADIRAAINVNLTSFCILNSIFLKYMFKKICKKNSLQNNGSTASENSVNVKKIRIIQISSLMANVPVSCLSMYCSVKAARDIYMRALAEEIKSLKKNKNVSTKNSSVSALDIKCLSYAPGMMLTEMLEHLCQTEDPDTSSIPEHGSKNLIVRDESARRMWHIVISDQYDSAEHIDAFDKHPALAGHKR